MRRIHLFAALLTFGLLAALPEYLAGAHDAERGFAAEATRAFALGLDAPGAALAPTFAPAFLDFGDLPAHALSPAQTLTFTNTAGTPLELIDVSLVSLNAPLFGGPDDVYFVYDDLLNPESCVWRALGPDARWTVLNPGEACTVSIRFNPTGTTNTTYTGELAVSYQASGGSLQTSTASLSGTATGPMACDPDLNNDGSSNSNVNVDITSTFPEQESERGGGSPPVAEVGQASLFQQITTALSGCGGPAYLGNPDDYSTWIAIGPGDVNVSVHLETVTMRYVETSAPDPGDDHGFLLLADKKIVSDGPATFIGDAHSNGEIDLKKGAPSTYDGALAAVGDLKIEKDNAVTDDALAGGTLALKGNATVGGSAEGGAPVAPVALPVLDFTAGGDAVTVEMGGTLALPPGSYGMVTVQQEATLVLAHDGTDGAYFFEALDMQKASLLTADATQGPLVVNVAGHVRLAKESEVVVTGAPATPSRFLTINSLADIDVKKKARIEAGLVAEGKVRLDKEVVFQGAICAEEIDLQKEVLLLHHDALPPPAAKGEGPVADAAPEEGLPSSFVLAGNYPNPFNPTTTIEYALPTAGAVRLAIYDVLGREVAVLLAGQQEAGRHTVVFDATGLPSGAYFYRLSAGGFTKMRRMVLLK